MLVMLVRTLVSLLAVGVVHSVPEPPESPVHSPAPGSVDPTVPGDPAPLPKRSVREHTLVLHDDARDKDLTVRVVAPDRFADASPAPVIIFSHGAGGSGSFYDPLAHTWASAGYIVLLPTHSDSLTPPGGDTLRGGGADASRRQRVREMIARRRGGLRGSGRGLDIDLTDWPNRPRDVSFIIDRLDEIEQRTPWLEATRIDHDRVGVGGHSYGAFTAQLIGGTDPLGPGDFADPRARCVLLISPQGVGGLLTASSWDDFVGPALTITGDNDTGSGGQDPAEWRREPFDRSPPDTHTLLWINDAYHNYGGISGRDLPKSDFLPDNMGPPNPHHVQLVQRGTLAFWDHHLRDGSDDVDAFAKWLGTLLAGEPVQIEHN